MAQKNFAYWFANLILGSLLIFTAGLLIYKIFSYKQVLLWHFRWQLTPYDPLIVYYVGPLVFICSLVVVMRQPTTLKLPIAVMLGSVALSLYFAELMVCITYPQAKTTEAKIQAAKERTNTTIMNLRAQGTTTVALIAPSTMVWRHPPEQDLFPLGGLSQVTTVTCVYDESCLIYQSDEHGFHNPPGLYRPDQVDIVILGDSFAHGINVSSEQNVTALLRQKFPLTLNFGISGNGPLAEFATFKEYVEPLRPKVVVWCYFSGNDLLFDLPLERNSRLRRYLDDAYSQKLFGKQQAIDQFLLNVLQEQEVPQTIQSQSNVLQGLKDLFLLRHLRLRLRLTLVPPAASQPTSISDLPYSPEERAIFRTILLKTQEKVASWNGRFYVVYLPAYSFFNRNDSQTILIQDHEFVIGLVKELGIASIDMYEVFLHQKDPYALFFRRRNNHYNQQGYAVVAETILQRLQHDPRLTE
jgi:hypothetical protein